MNFKTIINKSSIHKIRTLHSIFKNVIGKYDRVVWLYSNSLVYAWLSHVSSSLILFLSLSMQPWSLFFIAVGRKRTKTRSTFYFFHRDPSLQVFFKATLYIRISDLLLLQLIAIIKKEIHDASGQASKTSYHFVVEKKTSFCLARYLLRIL